MNGPLSKATHPCGDLAGWHRTGETTARVLVVDDDPVLRVSAALVLEQAGHAVCEAANGDEAFALIEAEPGRFTHLFTDIRMPGRLDGLNLARLVSTLHPAIIVIVTSGDAGAGDDAKDHCAHFVAKPWAPTDIVELVGAP